MNIMKFEYRNLIVSVFIAVFFPVLMCADDIYLHIRNLSSRDCAVTARAAWELGNMKEKAKSAIPRLVDTLNDARNIKTTTTIKGWYSHKSEEIKTVSDVARNSLIKIGEPSVEPLIDALHYARTTIARKNAAKALGCIGDKRACDPLLKSAKYSKERAVRNEAILALGELGDKKAIDGLMSLLDDRSLNVVTYTIHSLGRIEAEIDTRKIARFLNDKRLQVRMAASTFLRNNADVIILPQLVKALQNEKHHSIRLDLIRALETVKDARATEVLISALYDNKKMVRQEAARVLYWVVDETSVDKLEEAAKSDNQFVKTMAERMLKKARGET